MKSKKRTGSSSGRFTRGVKAGSKKRASVRRGARKAQEYSKVEISVPSQSLVDSLN